MTNHDTRGTDSHMSKYCSPDDLNKMYGRGLYPMYLHWRINHCDIKKIMTTPEPIKNKVR